MGDPFRSRSLPCRRAKVRPMTVPPGSAINPGGTQAPGASNSQDEADPLKQNAPASGAAHPLAAASVAGRPGLRGAVLHNSKVEGPLRHNSRPKDVLAELDNPVNVRHYLAALCELGHSGLAFDGGPAFP